MQRKKQQSQEVKMNKADDITLSETRMKQGFLGGSSETPGQGDYVLFSSRCVQL